MTPLEKYKTQFLEHLEVEKNRSRLTIRNYDLYLKRFLEFAKGRQANSPAAVDLDLVRSFRLFLNRHTDRFGRGMKLQTQTYHVIALRSFLKYLAKRDIKTLAAEKLELPKTPSRQVAFLEAEELQKLLAAPQKEETEILRLRDQAVLEMLFSTGLRVAELSGLKRDQVNPKKEEFTVRGKGDKIRIVFMSERSREALRRYLDARTDNSPALFVRHNREKADITDTSPLTPRTVQRLIKKYALLAGVSPHITP